MPEPKQPKRKTILITGASSGLGAEMARQFAALGHDLALCARRIEKLDSLKAEIAAAHPDRRVEVRTLDVNDDEQVFEVLPQPDEIEKAAARLHLNKQIDVATVAGFAPGRRAEHADIARTSARRISKDLVSTSAQIVEVDGRRFGAHAKHHVTAGVRRGASGSGSPFARKQP